MGLTVDRQLDQRPFPVPKHIRVRIGIQSNHPGNALDVIRRHFTNMEKQDMESRGSAAFCVDGNLAIQYGLN